MVKDKREVFQIFNKSGLDFPMIQKAVAASAFEGNGPQAGRRAAGVLSAARGAGNVNAAMDGAGNDMSGGEDDGDLQILWTGENGGDTVRILCQMTPGEGVVADSCLAQVRDASGNVVAEEKFVNFSAKTAFAALDVKREIFSECVLTMETAGIGRSVRLRSRSIPLDAYDAGVLEADFDISAPAIRREGDTQIKVSYYKNSSEKDYDYVYKDGRTLNKMYMDGEGSIELTDVDVEHPQIQLGIDGGKGMVWHPEPSVGARDNVIEYSNSREWKMPLWDVFDKNTIYGYANYLLRIQAQRTDTGREVSLLITNIPQLLAAATHDGVWELPKIHVYLDCFGEGTMIRMADGSEKAVEELRAGELLLAEGGRRVAVKEVRRQEACRIVTVTPAGGRSVSLTGGHGVYTQEGPWPAIRLKQGQQVVTESGLAPLQENAVESEGAYPVYALFLEDASLSIFANGMLVHNSEDEGLFDGHDWVREDLPEEWHEDYDNAVKAGIVYGG